MIIKRVFVMTKDDVKTAIINYLSDYLDGKDPEIRIKTSTNGDNYEISAIVSVKDEDDA